MNNTVQRRMVSSISWCFVAFLFVTFALTELLATPAGHKISLKGVPSINSVVGNGSVGSDGNGVPATQATMNYPYGLATDSAGNLYLADSNNFLVRVVNRQNVAITVAGVTIQPGNIATVAGSGTQGNSGDGGPALSAQFGWVGGIGVDAAGNIFILDEWYSAVRKIGTDGNISTVAGGSPSSCFTSGDNGDGGPAVGANLGCAYGLGVDAAGELFIGDTYNGRIRMVNTLGIISTIAGTSGNDCSFSEGAPGDGGSALDAILTCPVSVRVDSLGNPYFTDYVWGVVRYINRQSSAVTVNGVTIQPGNIDRLAGNYSLGYSGDGGPALAAEMYYPWDAALDTTGDLYINDSNNDIVRKVDNVGTITTFAGGFNNWGFSGDGGPALDAQLNYPTAIVLDSSHNIFVLDTDNNAIREISGNSVRSSVAFPPVALGSNTVQAVQLYMDQNVTISGVAANGDFAVTTAPPALRQGNARLATNVSGPDPDKFPEAVRKLRKHLKPLVRSSVVHPQDAPTACVGSFVQGDTCTMYVSFTPTKPGQRWFQLTATDSDQVQSTFGLTGVGVGPVLSITPGIIHTVNGSTEIGAVTGITRDNSGAVYTADYIQHVVFKIDGQGNSSVIAGELGVSGYDGDGGLAVNAHLNDPISLAFDSVGNLYIADVLNNAVRKIDVNGVITTVAGNGTAGYTGDGGAATGAELDNPLGVLADKSGNLYIGDTFNNVVRKVDVSGRITTVAGNGTGAGTGSWEGSDPEGGWSGDGGAATSAQLNGATGVALDGNGNLYIADTFNSAVRKVDGGGNITTVAGLCGDGCQQGYSGDGGPATEAMLDFPYGIATDAAGQLYIADTSNSAVRKVAADGTISTVAGNGLQAGPNARGKKWQGFVRKKNAHSRATDSNGDGGLATDANIFVPVQIAVDNNGNFYFTDVAMGNVRTVDVTTSLMDFGQVAPGSTSDSKTVTVTNAGNADLNFTQLSISDSFNWAGEGLCTTEAPLQAGANCLLSADFSPTEGGEYSGSIAITDDAFNSPHSVTLQGSAPTPDYTIAADPTTMTIHQGGTGTATLTVSAVDNYSGTITFGCSGLPAHSTCSFSPTSAVFDGGGDPVTVTLTVTTTGTGTTASLAVPRTGSGLPMDLWFVSTGLVGLVLAGAGRKRKMALRMLLALVVFAAIVGLNGCGSDSPTPHHNSNATPLGNYTTTVTTTATASGGGGAHSAPIAITVVQ